MSLSIIRHCSGWRRPRACFSPPWRSGLAGSELAAIGHGIAGSSPTTVLEFLKQLTRETGANYIACHMIFGSMRFEAAATSVRLLAREVMPKLQTLIRY
jgi:hypothetical protein